jgi:hypothetical protein
MQIVCSMLVLILMNSCYFITAFNLETLAAQNGEEEINSIVSSSAYSSDIELADLLDLDILDFNLDELVDSNEERERLASNLRHGQLSSLDRLRFD